MNYSDRKPLIDQLGKLRGSKVLCYIYSDRETFPPVPGFSIPISGEPQLLIADQLRTIGKTEKLDLVLYTRGGATDSVWPFISVLREYTNHLTVFVPFRAHSAGTLICLGADEVVMTEIGELSPIDPTTGNQFNPNDPTNPQNRFGISVEDVAAYFELAEMRAKIKTEALRIDVLKELTRKVHPLALGNVQRVYMQIRRLARSLLSLHLDGTGNSKKIDEIIKALTEEFYSHLHFINRSEARKLMGDWVRPPSSEEGKILFDLFEAYATTLQLREKFQLPLFMGDEQIRDLIALAGFIESSTLSHIYTTAMKVIQRPNIPSNIQIQIPPGSAVPLAPGFSRSFEYSILENGWKLNKQEI